MQGVHHRERAFSPNNLLVAFYLVDGESFHVSSAFRHMAAAESRYVYRAAMLRSFFSYIVKIANAIDNHPLIYIFYIYCIVVSFNIRQCCYYVLVSFQGDRCVLPDECPCHHNGQLYYSNDTIKKDCNTW